MAESYNTNLPHVAISYLKELNIPVTATSLKKQLNESPWFPSLYSLSSTFERFHIPHQAFKLEAENLDKLTPPFIAYLKNQTTGKDFVLLTSVSDTEVHLLAENKKPKKVAKEDFLKNWEHIVLQAARDEKSGEKDFGPNRENTIIKVCNSYCVPCAKAHAVFDEILLNNNNVN